ncbi:hypothetical protein D9M70_394680 [compost metagenome]
MAGVLDLTTFAQIRGVLTVSSADLPDDTLASYGLDDDLAVDLDGWVSGWSAIGDDAQKRLLRLYAKYFCAATVATTASVFVLTKATDGSNEGQRSDGEGFRWLADAMRGKAAQFKAQLLDSLQGVTTTSPTYSIISRVTPDRDPVTQARSANAS